MKFEGQKSVGNEIVKTTITLAKQTVHVHTNDDWTTSLIGATFPTNEAAEKVFYELIAAYPALREDDHHADDQFNVILDQHNFTEVVDEEA